MKFVLQQAGFHVQPPDVLTKKIYLSREELMSLYDELFLNHLSYNGWSWREITVARAKARGVITQYGTDGYIQWYVLSANIASLLLIITALQDLLKRHFD